MDESKQDQQAPEQKVNEQDQRGMESKKKTPDTNNPPMNITNHNKEQKNGCRMIRNNQARGIIKEINNRGYISLLNTEIIVWVKEDGDLLHRHSQTSSKAEYLCNMVSHPVP